MAIVCRQQIIEIHSNGIDVPTVFNEHMCGRKLTRRSEPEDFRCPMRSDISEFQILLCSALIRIHNMQISKMECMHNEEIWGTHEAGGFIIHNVVMCAQFEAHD